FPVPGAREKKSRWPCRLGAREIGCARGAKKAGQPCRPAPRVPCLAGRIGRVEGSSRGHGPCGRIELTPAKQQIILERRVRIAESGLQPKRDSPESESLPGSACWRIRECPGSLRAPGAVLTSCGFREDRWAKRG